MNVQDEIYDVVDENNQVIGQASRRHIHANNLLHRSVHIFVFNSKIELYLQKRALCKDENPGLWDTSSAGHVDAGETYDECANRELYEELGLKANLKPFVRTPACRETCGEHVQVYFCITDELIKFNEEEISEGAFFELSYILKKLSLNPTKFTSSFKLLFKQIREIENLLMKDKQMENHN
jgi:isopentenyldiphosphate isomerase